MTVTTNEETGIVTLTADNGKAIRRKGDAAGQIVSAVLRRDDTPDNWEDCDLVEPDPPEAIYSRWGIIQALEQRGLYKRLHEVLVANASLFAAFYGPDYFKSNDKKFIEICANLQKMFALSDKELAEILTESPYTPN